MSTPQTASNPIEKLSSGALVGIAVVITIICLFPTLQNNWVNWDDEAYVLGNRMVQELSAENVRDIFTTPQQVGLYHPFTMLSLAIDHHFWEKDAFGYHLTNLLLHLISVVLVFFFLRKIGGGNTVGFVAAALFGMHPMHVESVAWISGRKDVLYTVFLLLSILAYLKYSAKESSKRSLFYAASIIAFGCSLLSKSLAFTLPILLLLIDYIQNRKWSKTLLLDKLPFILLVIPTSIITKYGQQASDSMLSLTDYPIWKTAFMGSYNAIAYVGKLFVPLHLSPFHPFPFLEGIELPTLYYASAIPFFIGMYFLYKAFKNAKVIFFGVMFYLIAVGPVLMILPFGKAISSERYTYVAYIGLVFIIGMGVQKLLNNPPEKLMKYKKMLIGVAGIWLILLGIQTYRQSMVWENGETLWSQTIERYPEHYWGYMSRGTYRLSNRQHQEAFDDLTKAIKYNLTSAEPYYQRARAAEALGNEDLAFTDYSLAIKRNPSFAKAYVNRGAINMKNRAYKKALSDFNEAIHVDTSYALAYLNRGILYKLTNEKQNAISEFSTAIALEPWNVIFLRHRGVLYEELSNYDLAMVDFNKAVELDPSSGESFYLRSRVHFLLGNKTVAIEDANHAVRLGFFLPEGYLEIIQND